MTIITRTPEKSPNFGPLTRISSSADLLIV